MPPRVGPRTALDFVSRPGWLYRMATGPRLTFANFSGYRPQADKLTTLFKYVAEQFDPSASWDDLRWIRTLWRGRLAVKGILTSADASAAVECGADAIIVSNHGGRQLDDAPSAIGALPRIVDAVGNRAEVLLDGGVRRGSDVVKALAIGARACLVGRAFLYGLAAYGGPGVRRAVETLRQEIDVTQALLGCPDLAGIDSSFVSLGARDASRRPQAGTISSPPLAAACTPSL
jgi:L-lactate dehydrogenase (cytochrome)